MSVTLQQVLHLYLSDSRFNSKVVAWAFCDPTDGAGPSLPAADEQTPPYERGIDALRDGWRLIQASQLLPPPPGEEYSVSHLPFEFILERMAEPPPGGWPVPPDHTTDSTARR